MRRKRYGSACTLFQTRINSNTLGCESKYFDGISSARGNSAIESMPSNRNLKVHLQTFNINNRARLAYRQSQRIWLLRKNEFTRYVGIKICKCTFTLIWMFFAAAEDESTTPSDCRCLFNFHVLHATIIIRYSLVNIVVSK